MKTSHFYSPNHPQKICDIVVETIIDTYLKQNIDIHSDIYSVLKDNFIVLDGYLKTTTIIDDSILIQRINEEIGTDYSIINNIKPIQVEGPLEERTFGGIYLGYSCGEVAGMVPFEHEEARELTRFIYNELSIPLKTQIHVNGKRLAVSLEHEYDDLEKLNSMVVEFFDRDEESNLNKYNEPEIYHSGIRNDLVYKSGNSIISTFYGPRAWYGETNFVGSDFLSNKRFSHLICREYANQYLKSESLSYVAVEIDYTDNDEVPVHFGIKGNNTGIHLENGTFFEYGDIQNEYPWMKKIVLEKLRNNELNIIDIAKWGLPGTNI